MRKTSILLLACFLLSGGLIFADENLSRPEVTGETLEKEGKLREAFDFYEARMPSNSWDSSLKKKIIDLVHKLDPKPVISIFSCA